MKPFRNSSRLVLTFVTSAALKMVTDMERIGDQATDIAEILNTGSVHVPVTAIPLQEMADYAMHGK